MTGQKLYDVLREKYHLQMEMAAGNYVVAILTMMDRKEGIRRLLTALQKIDAKTAYRYEFVGGIHNALRGGNIGGGRRQDGG